MRHTGWCSARTVFMSLQCAPVLRTVPAADRMNSYSVECCICTVPYGCSSLCATAHVRGSCAVVSEERQGWLPSPYCSSCFFAYWCGSGTRAMVEPMAASKTLVLVPCAPVHQPIALINATHSSQLCTVRWTYSMRVLYHIGGRTSQKRDNGPFALGSAYACADADAVLVLAGAHSPHLGK